MVGDVTNGEGFPGNRKEPAGASPTPFIKKTVHPRATLGDVGAGEQDLGKAHNEKTAADVAKLKKEQEFGYGEPNLLPMREFTDAAASARLKQGETHGMDH